MANKIKKSGKKIAKRVTRFSRTARVEGKAHIYENLIYRISHVREVRLHILEWGLMVLAIILLAFTQSFWYSDSYSLSSFESGGTYTEATLGKIDSLNPIFASTNSEKTIAKLLFSSLAETDYSGHVGIGLAQSITSDESGKIWTVHLREGLKWSDGEPLTNADILFTANLIKNPAVSSIYSSNLSGVSIAEDDASNLVFTLPAAYVDFASALDFPILPKHVLSDTDPKLLLESDFSKNPVSSGPFTFNASQPVGAAGEAIVYLASNPNFYKGKTNLNSFAVHAYLDKDSIIAALNSGAVTATADLSAKDSPKILPSNIIQRNAGINSGVFAFLNTNSATLSNKTLRKAIQKGIDSAEIRKSANSNSPLNYPILANQADIDYWPPLPEYDVDAAKAEITSADISSDTPISIVTVNDGYLPEVAAAFADQLRTIGLEATVSSYDFSQDFIVNVVGSRAYDIFIYEIELGTEPDLFSYYHSSQVKSSGLNFSGYSNSIANDLILAARSTTDPALRNAKYASFLKYWVADIPAIALYQSNMTYFYNKNVRTFSEDLRLAVPTDRFTEINYWATEKTTRNRTP